MTARQASDTARQALQSGALGDAWTRAHGMVAPAIPIEAPRGHTHAWFVPVLYQDRLLGYAEIGLDLRVHRYASFMRREGQIDDCPLATQWLDPASVAQRAAALLQPGERCGTPYLSHDTHPSRLAWAVPVETPHGQTRLIYVAGDAVYPARSAGDGSGAT
ncbi:MAG TPA: hypothetical protein VFH49_16455 [Aquabacterium sp.]|nr:hypothetical protein [Aquabacterium sp.]